MPGKADVPIGKERTCMGIVLEPRRVHSIGEAAARRANIDRRRGSVEHLDLGSERRAIDNAERHGDQFCCARARWRQLELVDVVKYLVHRFAVDSTKRRAAIESGGLLRSSDLDRRQALLQLLFRWQHSRLGHTESNDRSVGRQLAAHGGKRSHAGLIDF